MIRAVNPMPDPDARGPRFDRVASVASLLLAWETVRRGGPSAGVDGVTLDEFARHADAHILALARDVASGWYQPMPHRGVAIPKSGGGERLLAIPTVCDRIVGRALLAELSPAFECIFRPSSFGFRPGRGVAGAHRWVERAIAAGLRWAAEFDLMDAFGMIEHDRIVRELRRRVSDPRIISLVVALLRSGICRGRRFEPWARGCPQGSPLSPLLCNVLLHRLDTYAQARGWTRCRYADDFVVLVRTRQEGRRAIDELRTFLQGDLGMVVHPAKTRVCEVEGLSFLGGRVVGGRFRSVAPLLGPLARLVRWLWSECLTVNKR
jgi:group II intron reverse transcriptase/maturase